MAMTNELEDIEYNSMDIIVRYPASGKALASWFPKPICDLMYNDWAWKEVAERNYSNILAFIINFGGSDVRTKEFKFWQEIYHTLRFRKPLMPVYRNYFPDAEKDAEAEDKAKLQSKVDLDYMISVIQAAKEGSTIETICREAVNDAWTPIQTHLIFWDWHTYNYRVAPTTRKVTLITGSEGKVLFVKYGEYTFAIEGSTAGLTSLPITDFANAVTVEVPNI